MPASFWFIQLIGLVGSVISFTSLQSGSRKKILSLQILCCLLWVVHYGLLGAYTGVLINLLGLGRAAVCSFNDRPWAKTLSGWFSSWPATPCPPCSPGTGPTACCWGAP